MAHPIILFDGVCNLCNSSVNFVIDRDPEAIFRLGALQSEEAQAVLTSRGLRVDYLDSIVLVDDDGVWRDSTAALRVARLLPGAWSLLYGLVVVPRPIRDWVYGVIARNRYRWFGRTEACRLPTPELAARFL